MPAPRPTIDPIIFRLWQPLQAAVRQPRRVHRLLAGKSWWLAGRDAHLHETPTLVLCAAGMIRIQHREGNADLGPGEAIVIEGGAWHAHVPSRAGTIIYEQGLIDRRAVWSLHDEDAYGSRFAIPSEPTASSLDALAGEADGEARCRRVARLFEATMSTVAEVQVWEPGLREMWNAAWRGLGRHITAAEVLAASGLSPRHAHRCFTAHFGETPKQMILRCRLELAKAQLRHGAGVAEAAQAAGFGCREDLTRHWRRRFGRPPREWSAETVGWPRQPTAG
jgi:AraC-like DNA-binding protein